MVQLTSQNRWPAYETTAKFVRFSAAGFTGWAANADVDVLFTELITRFNAEVEPLAGKPLDDWSWAFRPIRGKTTGLTNHASATAIDLNSTQHPRGVHDTFTAGQVAAIRRILNSITDDHDRPIFRWGHDYQHAPVDDMHFEINDDPAHAKQAADKLRHRPPVEEVDMQPTDMIKLTEAAARAMSAAPGATPRKAGDEVSVSYLLQWGGAGLARVQTEAAAQANRLKAVESRLALLESGTSNG